MRFWPKRKTEAEATRTGEEWCAAQDLRPFGFRIESVHATREQAERACGRSRYLRPCRYAVVKEINARLADHDEFMAELGRTAARERMGA